MGENHWGPQPPRSAPVKHGVGAAVGEASLSGAVSHLHREHPHPVQSEGLHHKSTSKIHHPISSGTYKG